MWFSTPVVPRPGRHLVDASAHNLSSVSVSCDEPNLVSGAGLLPAAVLAQKIGLAEVIERRVRLAEHGANSGAKALTVVGSMLLGGDCLADTALLQAGATGELFDQLRAPSTIRSWLRGFTWSNVGELDAVTRELLARLWAAGAGTGRPCRSAEVRPGLDDLPGLRPRQAGRRVRLHRYTKVRGCHRQLATLAETGQVIFSRLRGGPAGAAEPAGPGRDVVAHRDHQPTAQRWWHRPAHRRCRQRVLLPGDADHGRQVQ